ncbi:MAG: sigma-54-dependent transcriptional regulator [Desulfococcaceae bacterium]
MISFTIWIVDDENSIREGIVMALERDYQVQAFADAESALSLMQERQPDLLLLDIGLPGMDGISALKKIRVLSPDLPVVMITAYEDVKTVIAAMKLGAYDYVIKPILMPGLRATINNALETIRLKKEVQILQERYLKENMPCFIGESRSIQNVMKFISKVAKSPDTPILILGETGTGKELLARAVHYRSPNFKRQFVTVNCAAIPRDLIESELFGYEKGAFSGASSTGKKGLIEIAENGTLFLDEIGDLIPEAQAKLLRFLEEGEFYRIGGTRKLKVRTRVISATNRDLEDMMRKEIFRKDLFFRLGVVKVQIPSLNERREDILPIAMHFLHEYNLKFGKSFSAFTPRAEKQLISHNWIGNVRELKNMIERGVLVGRGSHLSFEELGLEKKEDVTEPEKGHMRFPPLTENGIDLPAMQEALEVHYIQEALRRTGGNETRAAGLLNLKPHNFRYRSAKLKKTSPGTS